MKNTYYYKIILLLALWLGYLTQAYSQDITITGNITDGEGNFPLAGVNVIIEGTTIGTTSDINGNYSLAVPNKEVKLLFSYIGYTEELIQVGDQTVIDVILVPTMENLEEIIVIGYGTQKKSDKTGAVASVSQDELIGGSITDPIQGLQGKIAGVSITKKGGDPNSGFAIKIRGASGFDASTGPLYVVNGVAGVDPTTIAPEDIERFDVLKDAASTAIYGSRGSNGVIFITTKNGQAGQSQITFNSNVSIEQIARKYDMLSASEIRSYVDENSLEFTDGGADVDWQDEVFRTGISQNYNLGFTGGSEQTSFAGNLSHSNWEGIMRGTEKQRTIGRLNIIHKGLKDRLTLTGNIQGTFEKNDYENYDGYDKDDIIYQTISHNPTDPVYDETGDYYRTIRAFNYENPLAIINQIDNIREAKRFLGNFKADLEIINGLVASVNTSYIRDDHEQSYFRPIGVYAAADDGSGKKEYKNASQKLIEITGTYIKSFGGHNLNLLAGYSWQEYNYNGFFAQARNPQSEFMSYNNLRSFTDLAWGDVNSWAGMWRLIGFFGRVQYNYDSKYFLTGSIRRDGSSKFGENNKWGTFPTISAGWDIHDEGFMNSVSIIEQLKLRASYGISGNQEIGEYRSLAMLEIDEGLGTDPETGNKVIVLVPAWNENPDLQWESTTEINIGLDFGLFNNRLNGSLDFYNKNTDNLLAEVQVPVPPNFARKTFTNTGKINNKGVELFIQGVIINKSNFQWKSVMTFSKNKLTIESLGEYDENEYRNDGFLSGRGLIGENNYVARNQVGHELGEFYLPVYRGLNDEGLFLYTSKTGGVTRDISDAQREFVGSPLPDYEFGFTQNFIFYKNFTIDLAMRALIGNDVYNATEMFFDSPSDFPSLNKTPRALDWSEKGRTQGPTIADIYVEDGSFLKIDYLALGYNIPLNNIEVIKSLKINLSANNLFTFTNYSGVDPETSFDGLSFGVDQYNVYPKSRSYSLGINATF